MLFNLVVFPCRLFVYVDEELVVCRPEAAVGKIDMQMSKFSMQRCYWQMRLAVKGRLDVIRAVFNSFVPKEWEFPFDTIMPAASTQMTSLIY